MRRNKLTPNKCAVACWRADVEDLNVDLQDAGPPLVDYPFAGDILMIEIAYHVIGTVSINLWKIWRQRVIGGYNHPEDYKHRISNTDQESNHKWFGCTLSLTPTLPAILIFVFKQDPFLPSAPFSRKCFLVQTA